MTLLSGAYAVSVVLFLGGFSPLRGTFFSVTDFGAKNDRPIIGLS